MIPSGDNSEHQPGRISAGQNHVTNVINAIMRSKDWGSTAIFLFNFNQTSRAPMLLPTIPAKKLRPWPFPGVHN